MFAHLWADLQQLLETYGIWAVPVSVFLESFGAPVPAESLLTAASVLAAEGKMAILPLLLLAWIGSVLGDNVGYCIGRFGGRPLILRYGAKVGLSEAKLLAVERFFDRYGGYIVLIARFFEGLRQFNGIVAGTSGMPWHLFLLFNCLGAALWVGAWGGGAYLLGQRIDAAIGVFKRFEPYFLVGLLLAAVLGGLVAYRLWKRHHKVALKDPR